jgi:hypothetical protein
MTSAAPSTALATIQLAFTNPEGSPWLGSWRDTEA